MNEYEKDGLEQDPTELFREDHPEAASPAGPAPEGEPADEPRPEAAAEAAQTEPEAPVPSEEPRQEAPGDGEPAAAPQPEPEAAVPGPRPEPRQEVPQGQPRENTGRPDPSQGGWGYHQGQGYYVPPRNPNPWQGGQYRPGQQWGGPGWQQGGGGPTTTGWQQPGYGQGPWQQSYTTGWNPQPPRGQAPGYQPQQPQQPGPDGKWDPAVPAATVPVKKKRRPLKVLLSILGGLLAVGVVCMAGYGIYTAVTGENPLAQPGGSPPGKPGQSQSGGNSVPDVTLNDKPFGATDNYDGSGGGSLSNTAIYNKVSPSVVGVVTYLSGSIYGGESQGSGIIMTEDGYIITNAHVVEGGMSYEVVLTNGQSYPATLVGADRSSDLAVLKVNETGLTYAEFGNSDLMEVGERVCAIGNPTGLRLQSSLTVGYVSAVGRTISTGGYSIDCIQTDAAINPGNSGGPLINAYGQVVGINSAKIAETDYEGIGFAIPITDAMPILKQLIADGKVSGRAMLGITAKAVKASDAEYYDIPLGLWVVEVAPGSDIAAKGVREGDIITHIEDSPIYSLDACSAALSAYQPGDAITITVFRRESSTQDNTFRLDIVLEGS